MNDCMSADPASSLASIYDGFAQTYDRNRSQFDLTGILAEFQALLPATGSLLDLGCGAGEPVSAAFAARDWQVTGVDLSESMLELARAHVPGIQTLHADLRKVELPPASFDAITSVYSLFHVPWRDHPSVFANVRKWLKPGGAALFTYATQDYTGADEFEGTKVFMGQELFYSHTTEAGLNAQLAEAGLETLSAQRRSIGGETFLWVTVKPLFGQPKM